MGEIKEVFDDVREKVGDKWFIALILVAGVFGLYNFFKGQNSSGNDVATVTTVTNYPVSNDDVIISTILNAIEYGDTAILEKISAEHSATNDYIHEGLKTTTENADKLSGLTEKVDTVANISATTYYETMLHQGRDGYIDYDPERALAVLENTGFDTSNEKSTKKNGKLSNTAGSENGGHTTFVGDNVKVG